MNFYLTTNGRISRRALWLAVLIPLLLVSIVGVGIDEFFWPEREIELLGQIYTPTSAVVALATLWPSFATSIRRFHDLNMSGWWVVTAVPMTVWVPDFANLLERPLAELGAIVVWVVATGVALLLFLAQLFLPGVRGENRFGSDPLSR